MAKARFIGQVRGYSVDDNGDVHLAIDDTEVSESAKFYVHDLEKSFNPQSRLHGFGAQDAPCNVRPGFGTHHFTVKADTCKGISYGSMVEVDLDIFLVRKVKFFNKKWGSILELRSELSGIRLMGDSGQKAKAAGDGGGVHGKQ